jgi:alkaline phosphatase D
MYDITCSPLTSGTHVFGKAEKDNPFRILGIDQKQNYCRVNVSGKKGDRTMQFDFCGIDGAVINSWKINEKELRTPKQN